MTQDLILRQVAAPPRRPHIALLAALTVYRSGSLLRTALLYCVPSLCFIARLVFSEHLQDFASPITRDAPKISSSSMQLVNEILRQYGRRKRPELPREKTIGFFFWSFFVVAPPRALFR